MTTNKAKVLAEYWQKRCEANEKYIDYLTNYNEGSHSCTLDGLKQLYTEMYELRNSPPSETHCACDKLIETGTQCEECKGIGELGQVHPSFVHTDSTADNLIKQPEQVKTADEVKQEFLLGIGDLYLFLTHNGTEMFLRHSSSAMGKMSEIFDKYFKSYTRQSPTQEMPSEDEVSKAINNRYGIHPSNARIIFRDAVRWYDTWLSERMNKK